MRGRDRYLKIVRWSDEDGCYVGTCPGLMLGGVHGDDEVRVYAELCDAVDEWIRIHEEDGEPLPEPTIGWAVSARTSEMPGGRPLQAGYAAATG